MIYQLADSCDLPASRYIGLAFRRWQDIKVVISDNTLAASFIEIYNFTPLSQFKQVGSGGPLDGERNEVIVVCIIYLTFTGMYITLDNEPVIILALRVGCDGWRFLPP